MKKVSLTYLATGYLTGYANVPRVDHCIWHGHHPTRRASPKAVVCKQIGPTWWKIRSGLLSICIFVDSSSAPCGCASAVDISWSRHVVFNARRAWYITINGTSHFHCLNFSCKWHSACITLTAMLPQVTSMQHGAWALHVASKHIHGLGRPPFGRSYHYLTHFDAPGRVNPSRRVEMRCGGGKL